MGWAVVGDTKRCVAYAEWLCGRKNWEGFPNRERYFNDLDLCRV